MATSAIGGPGWTGDYISDATSFIVGADYTNFGTTCSAEAQNLYSQAFDGSWDDGSIEFDAYCT